MNLFTQQSSCVFTVMRSPAEKVWPAIKDLIGRIHLQWEYGIGALDLASFCHDPPTYAPTKLECRVWSPTCNPTMSALVVDLLDGWQWLGPNLSPKNNIATTSISNIAGDFPLRRFTHYTPPDACRVVQVMRDDDLRWKYAEDGAILAFEDSADRQRATSRRLSKDLLSAYLTAIGWNPEDDANWMADRAFTARSSVIRYRTDD